MNAGSRAASRRAEPARPIGARLAHAGAAAARRLPLLVLPLAGLVVWQLVATLGGQPEWLLPAPTEVAETLWTERARLWFHARATIAAAALGFALAAVFGVALAAAIAAWRAADRAIYPWVIASQAIPLLALAPIIGIWADFGTAQIVVAFLITFFPVVVTGVDGLRAADPELARAARSLGASPAWVWRHVTFPGALPALFSGLKMAAVFAVTGAVVAEYVGADRGLGYLSELATAQFETVLAFAAIAWLAAIGLAFFGVVALCERLALPHRRHATRPGWRHR